MCLKNMDADKIPDYTNLTCTNLMIKLKILLKRLSAGEILIFYSTREQYDNIKKPFSKKMFSFKGEMIGDNKYLIEMIKN